MRDKGWGRSWNKAAKGLSLPDMMKRKRESVTWKENMKNKSWKISSFKSQACDTWISDDMMEVSGQKLWYTQSLWFGDNCKFLISRIQSTPCRGHSLAAEGKRKKTGRPSTLLHEQSQNSWEYKEASERRWGVRVVQEGLHLSKPSND